MNEFDLKAAGWDSNPVNIRRSEAVAAKIKEMVNIRPGMSALEYGAGTGITSFLLSETFSRIVLMDNSEGMIKVATEKAASSGVTNVTPLMFNLETGDYTREKFDIVFSQMVLHHIHDVPMILEKFYHLLNSDGFIAIADLHSEDGSFHDEGFTGHKGFDTVSLGRQLTEAGFRNIRSEDCFIVEKEAGGSTHRYPVFLMVGQK